MNGENPLKEFEKFNHFFCSLVEIRRKTKESKTFQRLLYKDGRCCLFMLNKSAKNKFFGKIFIKQCESLF